MEYDGNNIFAKIIRGEIDSEKIYEDSKILAIKDIYPDAPIHVLVIPKGNYLDFADFIEKASAEEVKYYFYKIKEIAELFGLKEEGYRLITNKGVKSGQTIFHFHTHILGGKEL